ncbi:MAG: addiction module protein [Verrucomicrobia bacterium]|nr:addiction module protein [Verrucomicrobiota bacterium]
MAGLIIRQKGRLATGGFLLHHFSMSAEAVSDLLRLPVRRRLAIAERLWLSVPDEQKMPVPEDHKRMLRKRLADYRAGRSKVISHRDMMRRLGSS